MIDAFHVVGDGPVPIRFFEDERKTSTRGIRLANDLTESLDEESLGELNAETEARWSLVESAWEMRLPAAVLAVSYDDETGMFLRDREMLRKNIAPARDSLNGYQKGACF